MARPANPDAQPVVNPLIPPGGRGERYFRGDCRGNADNSLKHCGQCGVIGRKLHRVFFDRRHSRVGLLDGAGGKRFGVPGRIEIAVRATCASFQPRTRTGDVETVDQEMKRPYMWRELFTRARVAFAKKARVNNSRHKLSEYVWRELFTRACCGRRQDSGIPSAEIGGMRVCREFRE